MKPKSQGPHDEGLLEYMEDIIGSNKHVETIEEGAKKCVWAASGFSYSARASHAACAGWRS